MLISIVSNPPLRVFTVVPLISHMGDSSSAVYLYGLPTNRSLRSSLERIGFRVLPRSVSYLCDPVSVISVRDDMKDVTISSTVLRGLHIHSVLPRNMPRIERFYNVEQSRRIVLSFGGDVGADVRSTYLK